MEEKNNLVFDEKIGNAVCQFDGKMWKLDGRTIPVRSISHVHYDKEKWAKITSVCCTIVCCALVGLLGWRRPERFLTSFYIAVCAIEIILTLFIFIYNEHMVRVITCSGKQVRIPSRDKEALRRLENALVSSLQA